MSFALRGLSSFRVSFIRGFTVGRYQRDVVGKGVCMRVERLGGEEVWFLFDFCNADRCSDCDQLLEDLQTGQGLQGMFICTLQNSLARSFFRSRFQYIIYTHASRIPQSLSLYS